jgi:hypothetical protein
MNRQQLTLARTILLVALFSFAAWAVGILIVVNLFHL